MRRCQAATAFAPTQSRACRARPTDLEPIRGPIQYRHAFLDMRGLRVDASNFTRAGTACKPAMGFAFAAGTTDGEGSILVLRRCGLAVCVGWGPGCGGHRRWEVVTLWASEDDAAP